MHPLRADRSLVAVPVLLLAGLLAVACESNSSSSGDEVPDPGDSVAPLAVVQFPPDRSLTDAPRVGLTISVADGTGVASVQVAGRARRWGRTACGASRSRSRSARRRCASRRATRSAM